MNCLKKWRWLGVLVGGLIFGAGTSWTQQTDADAGFEVGARLQTGGGVQADGFVQIEWDDLIPADWVPEELFKELFEGVNLDALDDYDPRAMEVMQQIRELWDRAPVVPAMDNRRIRIPGFVVPLEGDASEIHDFLLVPYFGACIHVPPPPVNQLIHVMPDQPIPAAWNMMPVWVSGVLHVSRFDSDLGNAGYQLRGIRVEEYVETEDAGR